MSGGLLASFVVGITFELAFTQLSTHEQNPTIFFVEYFVGKIYITFR